MDLISREAAIKEAYKIVIDGDVYEVVQVETLLGLPTIEHTLYGYNVRQLALIARVLQERGLSPERVTEALTDIAGIVEIVKDEFEETLKRSITWK